MKNYLVFLPKKKKEDGKRFYDNGDLELRFNLFRRY